MSSDFYVAAGLLVLILGILAWSLLRGVRGKGRIK